MPSFPIVDSHVHLYDPSWLGYSWLNGSKINRRYDLADFDSGRADVTVEADRVRRGRRRSRATLAEAAWVQELADATPARAG